MCLKYKDSNLHVVLMKVQFWGTSTVTAVETMGYPGGTGRVTLYRLKFSTDCVSFYPLLDGNGNNAVLCLIIMN